VSGDIFCLQGRYDEAEDMYKNAEAHYEGKERLARLKELKKAP
jgi:hypothetical protein